MGCGAFSQAYSGQVLLVPHSLMAVTHVDIQLGLTQHCTFVYVQTEIALVEDCKQLFLEPRMYPMGTEIVSFGAPEASSSSTLPQRIAILESGNSFGTILEKQAKNQLGKL